MSFLLEETISQGLVFRQAPPLWVIFLVIVPAIIGFVAFFYRMGKEPSGPVRGVLAALRILLLLLFAALLMDPALETQVVEQRKALAIVLVDVSASMDHRDDYSASVALGSQVRVAAKVAEGTPLDSMSRLDLVKRVVDEPGNSLLDRLGKENDLRIYTFGESLNQTTSLSELEARDRVTALGRAIERILDEPEVKSRPVGGLVVITDGKNTEGPLPDVAGEIARKRKIPIHTVGVGDPQALKDIEIVSLNSPEVVLLGDTMIFDLRIRQRGFTGQRATVQVLENNVPQELVAPRAPIDLIQEGEEQSVRAMFKPDREGRFRLTVQIKPLPGEFEIENNSRIVDVVVRRERLRVLYVDQLPRWEYRKLQDYLTRGDESFESRCLLLSAQVGFINESSRNVTPIEEFPQTEDELFAYDVIIFGDVNPDQLSPNPERQRAIMESIRRFVENGGGFAMIAGDRFAPWAYRDTPIAELLPIVIDPSASASSSGGDQGFTMRLTELGKGHPVMQLLEDPERNAKLWRNEDREFSLPPSWWFAQTLKAKPGAMVLAVHGSQANRHGPFPILVAGSYGQGPVYFSAIDETWRWYKWQGAFLHHRYWGNLTHHLARTRLYAGNKRFRLTTNRSEYAVGERITITAYVKDRSYRPSTKEEQQAVLRHPDHGGKGEERLVLPQVEPGVFEKTLVAQETGKYELWIPPEESGDDERVAPTNFAVVVSDLERREPILDVDTLSSLSARTEGRHVLLPEAKDVLEQVAGGTVDIPRQRRFISLRDGELSWIWWIPVAFLTLLTAEWLLRKRSRLL